MKPPGMERREFLKAGLSAMALAASPGLSHALATPVSAHEENRIGFIFAALNTGGIDSEGVNHRFFMTGEGAFGKEGIEGGGSYIHFDWDTPGYPLENPMTLLETGTWRATRLIRWAEGHDPWDPPRLPFGTMTSGILDLTLRLFPVDGPPQGVSAEMTLI